MTTFVSIPTQMWASETELSIAGVPQAESPYPLKCGLLKPSARNDHYRQNWSPYPLKCGLLKHYLLNRGW